MTRSSTRIGRGFAVAAAAFALSALPVSLDGDAGLAAGKAAHAAPGGNGKGKGNGHGNGHGLDNSQQAKAAHAKDKVAKDDPMHPSNLGRLNGFFHASPQALKNASPNSAVGILGQTYRDALLGYAAAGTQPDDTEEDTITEDDLAAILAKAANKPLSGEQVIAIHEKLIAENPELAETTVVDDPTTPEVETGVDLMDPDFADQLADEANAIQATETNQGLGSGDESDESDVADDQESEDGDQESDDGFVADAADTVTEAAEDTAEAVGDFFAETF